MESFSGLSTKPSMVSVQLSAFMSPGGMPLLRMKWRAVGVTSSSRLCGGVSALTGRSFRIVSPFLPLIIISVAAMASGMKPDGMLRWNGMVAPISAPMVARPAPFRNPRRSLWETRPNTSLSASSGSSA